MTTITAKQEDPKKKAKGSQKNIAKLRCLVLLVLPLSGMISTYTEQQLHLSSLHCSFRHLIRSMEH